MASGLTKNCGGKDWSDPGKWRSGWQESGWPGSGNNSWESRGWKCSLGAPPDTPAAYDMRENLQTQPLDLQSSNHVREDQQRLHTELRVQHAALQTRCDALDGRCDALEARCAELTIRCDALARARPPPPPPPPPPPRTPPPADLDQTWPASENYPDAWVPDDFLRSAHAIPPEVPYDFPEPKVNFLNEVPVVQAVRGAHQPGSLDRTVDQWVAGETRCQVAAQRPSEF